jgi:hypothetical protein
MLKAIRFAGAAWLVTSVGVATALLGCGGPAPIPPEQAAAIPVHNPSPDNPLKDVTLQNEYQFKYKIGGMSMPKQPGR